MSSNPVHGKVHHKLNQTKIFSDHCHLQILTFWVAHKTYHCCSCEFTSLHGIHQRWLHKHTLKPALKDTYIYQLNVTFNEWCIHNFNLYIKGTFLGYLQCPLYTGLAKPSCKKKNGCYLCILTTSWGIFRWHNVKLQFLINCKKKTNIIVIKTINFFSLMKNSCTSGFQEHILINFLLSE